MLSYCYLGEMVTSCLENRALSSVVRKGIMIINFSMFT